MNYLYYRHGIGYTLYHDDNLNNIRIKFSYTRNCIA